MYMFIVWLLTWFLFTSLSLYRFDSTNLFKLNYKVLFRLQRKRRDIQCCCIVCGSTEVISCNCPSIHRFLIVCESCNQTEISPTNKLMGWLLWCGSSVIPHTHWCRPSWFAARFIVSSLLCVIVRPWWHFSITLVWYKSISGGRYFLSVTMDILTSARVGILHWKCFNRMFIECTSKPGTNFGEVCGLRNRMSGIQCCKESK